MDNAWQPLDKAPLDGTRVLIGGYHTFGDKVIGTWVEIAAWGGSRPPCWKQNSDIGRSVYGTPSFWMPLPQLPVPQPQEVEAKVEEAT